MEIKTVSNRRDLFARKGEAMPTSAVVAGFKPKPSGNNGDGVSAAPFSSLISRRHPRAPVIAPEAFHRMEPLQPPRMAEDREMVDITPAETHRRYSFTVRLQPAERMALVTQSIRSGRTYQAIIEEAIRKILKENGKNDGEKDLDKAIKETSHFEPATANRALSKLISRA